MSIIRIHNRPCNNSKKRDLKKSVITGGIVGAVAIVVGVMLGIFKD